MLELSPIRVAAPLDEVALLGGSICLSVDQRFGSLNLRGSGALFHEAVRGLLHQSLPVKPNTTSRQDDAVALWLGPDEWLLSVPLERLDELRRLLSEGLAGQHSALVDVTDIWVTLRLSGRKSRNLLAKGCPLDLHPSVFGPGACAQSLFLKAGILLYQLDATPTYDIRVRRSLAEYLWKALVDAADEF